MPTRRRGFTHSSCMFSRSVQFKVITSGASAHLHFEPSPQVQHMFVSSRCADRAAEVDLKCPVYEVRLSAEGPSWSHAVCSSFSKVFSRVGLVVRLCGSTKPAATACFVLSGRTDWRAQLMQNVPLHHYVCGLLLHISGGWERCVCVYM